MLTSGKNLGGQFTAREGNAFALSQFALVARELDPEVVTSSPG